ncbi:MAG: SH3 domain-containing protein [Lachnospiraceae bacterium]|nr:SH3 domain-containing protein [Lachnospiraceae bacterium]
MDNQSWKDKVKGAVNYLKVHLTNLFLMCKENSKVMKITVAFLAVVIVVLVLVAMMETKSATSTAVVSTEEGSEASEEEITVPEEALEKDAYPEVNNLVKQYYQALADGDLDTIRSIKSSTDDKEEIIIVEKSKYLEAYPVINVYTKKGPEEGSFVAYAQYEVKMYEYDTTVPGVNTLYICQRDDGTYFINEDVTQETLDYIKVVTAHNDVIDLYNTVQVQYNEIMTADAELSTFLMTLPEQLKTAVSLSLAQKEAENAPEEEEVVVEETETTVVTKVKTTDVVNVRSSDSIEADRIGKTTQGQVLELVEERVNGWSKVIFEGKEGFIKTEFLEPEETMTVEAENTEEEGAEEESSTTSSQSTTKGKVTDTVNVRKAASTDGEKLGQLSEGSEIEIIEKMSSGWTKIKYNGGEAYVKSDYVE